MTRYFTFGHGHRHVVENIVFDVNTLVQIKDENPRRLMTEYFGTAWCGEYKERPAGYERMVRL